jgi:hypothetical protein
MLALAILIVALGAPRPADAWERDYSGEVMGGPGQIGFLVLRKHGDLRIKSISASFLPLQCSSGLFAGEFEIGGVDVNRKRSFHVKREAEGSRASGTAKVDGRLLRGGRAVGTLRQFDDFDETHVCDTGVLEWEAHR